MEKNNWPCLAYCSVWTLWRTTADPIELWTSPPFEPVIKTTELHPEGVHLHVVLDDKEMYMHVKAFEYMIQNNNLPLQREIHDWRGRSRKNLKLLLRTIKRNLKMMSSWFLIPEWFLISSLSQLALELCRSRSYRTKPRSTFDYTVALWQIQLIFLQNDCVASWRRQPLPSRFYTM
jgi:hypothetical protein